MRLATYLGLVLLRVWARRLMLLGSFLGATLVVALLAVLPLFEGSVAAVDLLFTFRQAPDASVDLSAVSTFTEYSGQEGRAARAAVAKAAAPLSTWYPVTEERTASREFSFIPLDHPDWLGQAAAWRDQGALPEATPWPASPPEATRAQLFTSPDLVDRIALVEGSLVAGQDPSLSGDPILQVVLGEQAASLTGLGVGDRVILRAFSSQPAWFEIVEVSGVARPVDPSSALWDGIDPSSLVFVDPVTFDAWAGTFTADPRLDPWLRSERGLRRLNASQTFTLHLDREAVTLENVPELRGGVTAFTQAVAREENIRTTTRLPALVEAFGVRTVVFGAPILAMLALVVAGALYFLIYMAALALESESAELALLRMRGATPWQTVGIHLTQSGMIAVAATGLAPLVARGMVALSGRVPPMSTLTGGQALSVSQTRSILPFVVGGGALTFAAMGLAILPLARRGVLELRALASRPGRRSVWQRYYVDVFLVVLAAVVLYDLRQRGLVGGGTAGELGLDPFSVAAPALFLFSGALLLLRVLPWVLRGIGWLMTRTRGMATALSGWHLGRNPVPYGRLALLVWLTTGFGAFALTYAATLTTSYRDRAAFEAGSDVRIVAEGAGLLAGPPGAISTPVYRTVGAPRISTRTAQLLAVRPSDFPEVVNWRKDFGDLTLLGETGLGGPVDWGVELPTGTSSLRVEGVAEPRTWADVAAGREADPVRLLVRVVDEDGRFRVFASDAPFGDQAWTTVSIDLGPAVALNGPFDDAGGSLTLQALWFEREPLAGAPALPETKVYLDEVTAVAPAGAESMLAQIVEEMRPAADLGMGSAPGDAPVDAYYSAIPDGATAPTAEEMRAGPLFREGEVTVLSLPLRIRAQEVPYLARPADPLPIVMDSKAASIAALGIGGEAMFGIDGKLVMGVMRGTVELVPTATDPRQEGVLVTRLDGLTQWLDGAPAWSLGSIPARFTEPQELWVSTDDPNQATRWLRGELGREPDQLLTTAGVSADFSSRPIQVGLVSILLIGTGAGVVLTLAGVTGYVLVAVRRRFREMGVLRALGLRRRGVAASFALEQLVVLGLGAVIGVAAGLGLMRLMIPFLQLGEQGRLMIPPAVMELPWARLGIYLGMVTAVLLASVLWSTRAVSARRLSEVLREVER
jgi:hypothetical protein